MIDKRNNGTAFSNTGSNLSGPDLAYLQSLSFVADPDGRDVLVCKDEHALPTKINAILTAAKIPDGDDAAQYKLRENHVVVTGRHPVSYIERAGAKIEGRQPSSPTR